MPNDFSQIMAQQSDEALVKIVSIESHKYQPEAIEAAQQELQNRQIDINDLKKRNVEHFSADKKVTKPDSVSSDIRFVHLLIDTFAWQFMVILISFLAGLVFQPVKESEETLISFIIIFGTYFGYYIFFETKYQKTIGKFITNTKVINTNGTKPEITDITARTFYRLIPFDTISYLFTRRGFHDYLSQTKVIKEKRSV